MAVLLCLVVLMVGALLGAVAGTHDERKRWEKRLADGLLFRAERQQPTPREERLEQAVDTVAIEVERIAESQRFLTKLLIDRGVTAPEKAGDKRGRVITPH